EHHAVDAEVLRVFRATGDFRFDVGRSEVLAEHVSHRRTPRTVVSGFIRSYAAAAAASIGHLRSALSRSATAIHSAWLRRKCFGASRASLRIAASSSDAFARSPSFL